MRSEHWKATHENVNVLELESDATQLLFSQIRDRTTKEAQFRLCIQRLVNLMVEELYLSMDTEEVEVETPAGYKYSGDKTVVPKKFCLVGINSSAQTLSAIVESLLPPSSTTKFELPEPSTENGAVKNCISKESLGSNPEDTMLILVKPVIVDGRRTNEIIRQFLDMGFTSENIRIMLISTSPEGIESVCTEFPEVKIISGSLDFCKKDESYGLVPGFGDLDKRLQISR